MFTGIMKLVLILWFWVKSLYSDVDPNMKEQKKAPEMRQPEE